MMKKEMDPMEKYERIEGIRAKAGDLMLIFILAYTIIMLTASVLQRVSTLFYVTSLLVVELVYFSLLDISIRWRQVFVVIAFAIVLSLSAYYTPRYPVDTKAGKYEFTIRFIDTNMELKWQSLPEEPNQTL